VEITTTVVGTLYVDRMATDEGFPVLVHAGSPGVRGLYEPAVEQAAAHGVRLISYDRPGYGDTPPEPGRSIVDGATATRAIADALGISRLAVYGFSGGGPYALACAALLPELVTRCCVFASPSPAIPMGPEYERAEFTSAHEEIFARLTTTEGWLSVWGDAAETDEAHSRRLAAHLVRELRCALAHGDQGWWDDYTAIHRPWGVDLSTIHVPVQLWQGGRDRNVPPAHGHWLAEHIPGVDFHFLPDADHATIEVNHREAAYEWLAS
jgi:pimeloyl-ACP methyl ester carboxylesterase